MGLLNWRRNAFGAAILFFLLLTIFYSDSIRSPLRMPAGTGPKKYMKCVKVAGDKPDDAHDKLDCHEVSPPWNPVGGQDDGKYDEKEAADAKGTLDKLRKGMTE